MNDAAAFMAQFPAARAEVAELARLYPTCFDANGRPIVAELTWPTTRTDMNLQTAADCHYSAAASEPATDVHPLGAPINRAKPTQDDPGRWVPATTADYFVHTKTGALSHRDNIPFPERPWHKPATVTCERDDVDLMLQIVDAAGEADKRTGSTDESDAVIARYSSDGLPGASSVPPERREECIAALRAIRADDSATCAVPSVDALIEAYERVPHKRLDGADSMLCAATGWRSFNWADIPADRRADVIRALNQLGR